MVIELTMRRIETRRQSLAQLDVQLRALAPTMFSAEQCQLPSGEIVVRQRRDTGAVITLHGSRHADQSGDQAEERCRLTIANLGLAVPLDITCRPEDVNLIGFLLSEALAADIRCGANDEA